MLDGEDPDEARKRLAPPSMDDLVANINEVLNEAEGKQVGNFDEVIINIFNFGNLHTN